MAFVFNWSRLDDTASEVIRHIINDRLASLLNARLQQHAAGRSGEVGSTADGAGAASTSPPMGTTPESLAARSAVPGPTGCQTPGDRQRSSSGNLPHGEGSDPTDHGGSTSHDTTATRLPPLASLTLSSLDWGNAPPFLEIVNFEQAMIFPANPAPKQPPHLHMVASTSISTSSGPTTPFVGDEYTDSASDTVSAPGGSPGVHHTNAAVSSNHTIRRRSTHGGVVGGMNASSTTVGRGASTSMHPATPQPNTASPSPSGTSSSAASADLLAPLLGPSGLFVRLHLTYGGSLHFSISTVLQHQLTFGPIRLPITFPMTIHISELHLDGYLCMNLHQNTCRVWMEPGKLATSPVSRLQITGVFGGEELSSADFYSSRPESMSHASEDVDDSVFIDERELGRMLLHELKTALQEMLMAPHYVTIPLQR